MIFELTQEGKLKPMALPLPDSAEYKKQQKLLSQTMSQLKDSIGKDYDKVEELVNIMSALQSIEDTEHFSYGFAIGVRLMMEVYRACKIA